MLERLSVANQEISGSWRNLSFYPEIRLQDQTKIRVQACPSLNGIGAQ
jgi:hypothetical protein